MTVGTSLRIDDLRSVESVDLTDLDPNAAHITLISHQDGWRIFFDFRYNASRVAAVAAVAREFLDIAEVAISKKYVHAAVDTLFSATELMAKGRLLMLPDRLILDGRSHGLIHSAYNLFGGKQGNVDQRYVKQRNRLTAIRGKARYETSIELADAEMADFLKTGREMLAELEANMPTRVSAPPSVPPSWGQ
jgi:uncharacterized protein (UPF0332 family)